MKALIQGALAVLAAKGSISEGEFHRLLKEARDAGDVRAEDAVPQGWAEHFVPFVRTEGMKGVTTVAMLTVWSPLADDEIVAAIKRALTRWVGSTEAGKKAWSATCEDFNVGDLLQEGWLRDDDLTRLLNNESVLIAEGVVADADQAFTFDHVLVDASDPGVQAALQEE